MLYVSTKVICQQQEQGAKTRTRNENQMATAVTNVYKDLINEWQKAAPCAMKCDSLLDQIKVYLDYIIDTSHGNQIYFVTS